MYDASAPLPPVPPIGDNFPAIPESRPSLSDWVREQAEEARRLLGRGDLDGCDDALDRLIAFAEGP